MLIDYYLLGLTGVLLYEGLNKLTDKIAETNKPKITPTTLVLGYNIKNKKIPITLETTQFPSLSISGITNSGKSRMVHYLLLNTSMDIVLVNSYSEDYKEVKCKRISLDDTESFLDACLNGEVKDKLIVFDECLTIINNKNCAKKLHTLLTKNRHMNLIVLCIFQELNKTIVPFKSLFSARLTMRMLQASDVASSLGTTIEGYKALKNREFILLSDDIYYGKTYDVK